MLVVLSICAIFVIPITIALINIGTGISKVNKTLSEISDSIGSIANDTESILSWLERGE